jgi:hypothetical protein
VGYKIVIHHLTSEDILEIARWYDCQLAGLGNKFESDLENAISKLINNPLSFKAVYTNIRRVHLKHFPYLIFYQVIEDDIHLYGVMHSKRNPVTIKRRFKNIRFKS